MRHSPDFHIPYYYILHGGDVKGKSAPALEFRKNSIPALIKFGNPVFMNCNSKEPVVKYNRLHTDILGNTA